MVASHNQCQIRYYYVHKLYSFDQIRVQVEKMSEVLTNDTRQEANAALMEVEKGKLLCSAHRNNYMILIFQLMIILC